MRSDPQARGAVDYCNCRRDGQSACLGGVFLMQPAHPAASSPQFCLLANVCSSLLLGTADSEAVDLIFALFAVCLSCSTVQITMLRFGIWGVIGLVQLTTESPQFV